MSTATETYQGWTNYETWNVALWIGNDQGLYEYWRERTQEAYDATDEDKDAQERKDEASLALVHELKEYVEENNPLANGPASMYQDILGAAIADTNWYEITSNWIDELE